MLEIEQAAFTLLGGVLIFIFGEFARVLTVVPLQKYREHVQATLSQVAYYSNQITSPFSNRPDKEELERMQKISADLRSAATQLESKYAIISLKKLLATGRLIPSKKQLDEACRCLILLSNNLPQPSRARSRDPDHDPLAFNLGTIRQRAA